MAIWMYILAGLTWLGGVVGTALLRGTINQVMFVGLAYLVGSFMSGTVFLALGVILARTKRIEDALEEERLMRKK